VLTKGGKYILGALGLPRKDEGGEPRYETTVYTLVRDGQKKTSKPTGLTMRALVEFFPEFSPVFLTTGEAKRQGWQMVVDEFGYSPRYIDIPEGRSEEEIWNAVVNIVEKLPEDAEIIIDVTHGYRTLPLLALQSALLAEEMGEVSISGVFYGAREAKTGSETPFFDMTPLLNIQKWSRALGDLRRFSHAEPLLELLKGTLEPVFSGSQKLPRNPANLSSLAGHLENMGLALRTIRVAKAVDTSKRLGDVLPAAERELEYFPELRAIAPFLQPSFRELASFAPGDYQDFSGKEALLAMVQTLHYYLRTQAYPEAVTLAREALVSYCVHRNGGDFFDRSDRELAEKALNQWEEARWQKTCSDKEMLDLWQTLSDLRNDINHAGFRSNARRARKAQEQIENVCGETANYIETNLS